MSVDVMSLENFLLGFTVINFGFLLLSFAIWLFAQPLICRWYCALLKMTEAQFSQTYFVILAIYKIFIVIFGLTPYLVLKLWF